MRVWKVKKGEVIAKKQEKVLEWYLIQEGSVSQSFVYAQILLERNSMIGILESEWFICDYVAKEDTTLIVIPCKNAVDLQIILSEHENYRAVFLRAALEQKQKAMNLYMGLQEKATLLHAFAESAYNNYKSLCEDLFAEEQPFVRMETFEPLTMTHLAENWEFNSIQSLMNTYLRDYLVLMIKDEALCVGAIMEAAAQVRRITQGILEMTSYLHYNKDILWAKSQNDLFHLFFDLAVQQSKQKKNIEAIQRELERVYAVMQQLGVFDQEALDACEDKFRNYDFESVSKGRMNVAREDCVNIILTYAGYEANEIVEAKELFDAYAKLPDRMSGENEVYQLRKRITKVFYDAYKRAFFRAMEDKEQLSPVLLMFFHFGFMDVKLLGEEYTNALYNLIDRLSMFHGSQVYTIFEWLSAIYHGKKEPSKNELDLDYKAYLLEERKSGNITEQQVEQYKGNNRLKAEYELNNMFPSGHRMTFGRVTTFCPVLCADDFLNSIEKMVVTAERLIESINKVRAIDYSAFYREILFTDAEHGISQEWIMKEVLPDIILMPCVGVRGAMWQETEGIKADTPARFLFPLFTTVDLQEQMIDTVGRYRWEICRHIQGVYWNDIREKSLTSEYCDYLQFYRKNSELSPEVKEKLKQTLQRARNNYREVFVKDYQNWMKYESKGSFRLNKVVRNILISYCPFSKDIREELKLNPIYQSAINKLDIENRKKESRLHALYDKYEAAGGIITPDLKENLRYYQL